MASWLRFNLLFLLTLFFSVHCTQPVSTYQPSVSAEKPISKTDEDEDIDADVDEDLATKKIPTKVDTKEAPQAKPEAAKPEADLQTRFMNVVAGTWQTGCIPFTNPASYTETITIAATGGVEYRYSDYSDANCTRPVNANAVNYIHSIAEPVKAIKENGGVNSFITQVTISKALTNGVLSDAQGRYTVLVKVEGTNLTWETPADPKATSFSSSAIMYVKK